jgi:DNA-binding HxlR family transcriptional regulator
LTGRMTAPDPDQGPRLHAPLVHPAVLDLIRRPYVAELLAALDARPHTLAELRHSTGGPRRLLVDGLRALAAHYAITRTPDAGSWDRPAEPDATYRLTPVGHALIEDLFTLDVWRAAYDT